MSSKLSKYVIFYIQECVKPMEKSSKETAQPEDIPSASKIRIEIEDDSAFKQMKEVRRIHLK
jgi:hypothetical protein